MPKKPVTLSDALARKAGAAPAADAPKAAAGAVVTVTMRLPEAVHDQLRRLAFDERVSQHALMREALGMLFKSRGLPPIAL